MTIRPIQEGDVPSVVSLILRNWDEVMLKHHSPSTVAKFRAKVTHDGVKRQMEQKRILVVERDGEVVATGALANFGSTDEPMHTVSQFFVRPDLHSQGIGKALLHHLIGLARDQGIRQLHVPSSRNAIPFYQRFGFSPDADQPSLGDEITWMTMAI
jgi:predicted N-acetyltransferase YhbS